jgi:hypothetical protein
MAMATLQDTAIPTVTPLHLLRLSVFPNHGASSPLSIAKAPPLFLKSFAKHPLHEWSAQDLFTMFRPAGAIRLLGTNVNVGHSHPVSVIEYYASESAPLARNILHGTLSRKGWPDCYLQAYAPTNLRISVST